MRRARTSGATWIACGNRPEPVLARRPCEAPTQSRGVSCGSSERPEIAAPATRRPAPRHRPGGARQVARRVGASGGRWRTLRCRGGSVACGAVTHAACGSLLSSVRRCGDSREERDRSSAVWPSGVRRVRSHRPCPKASCRAPGCEVGNAEAEAESTMPGRMVRFARRARMGATGGRSTAWPFTGTKPAYRRRVDPRGELQPPTPAGLRGTAIHRCAGRPLGAPQDGEHSGSASARCMV